MNARRVSDEGLGEKALEETEKKQRRNPGGLLSQNTRGRAFFAGLQGSETNMVSLHRTSIQL